MNTVDCTCYVRQLDPKVRPCLRRGVHHPQCAVYLDQQDPNDEKAREYWYGTLHMQQLGIAQTETPTTDAAGRVCVCYVSQQTPEVRYSLRYGAHDPLCPVYRESGDPVDRAEDAEYRRDYLGVYPEHRMLTACEYCGCSESAHPNGIILSPLVPGVDATCGCGECDSTPETPYRPHPGTVAMGIVIILMILFADGLQGGI